MRLNNAIPLVLETTKQRKEIPTGIETSVWTERLLAALGNGVKGGNWLNSYFSKIGLFTTHESRLSLCQSR